MTSNGDWLWRDPIAHRGLHDSSTPENSLAAFERAMERQLPIELDVHLSSDGHLVVFHDSTLGRMTGAEGKLSTRTLKELQRLRLHASECTIPSLGEVFSLVAGRVPILIEIKNAGEVGALEAELTRAVRSYEGPVAIQSFNPHSINYLREESPQILRGQLAGDFSDDKKLSDLQKAMLKDMHLNSITKPDFIAYDIESLDSVSLEAMKSKYRSIPVILWTVRTYDQLAFAKAFDCNVIFEGIDPRPVTTAA